MNELYTRKEIEQKIKTCVGTNPKGALKALLTIYSFQTSEEQTTGETIVLNNMGFTSADAEFLTSLATRVSGGGNLSEKQMNCLYHCMPKYSRQLFDNAYANGVYTKVGRKYSINC